MKAILQAVYIIALFLQFPIVKIIFPFTFGIVLNVLPFGSNSAIFMVGLVRTFGFAIAVLFHFFKCAAFKIRLR
ncbi:hypothetical protein GALL_510110 [mine drainage metagenome]|uniref:Uncharacterized protein n=1 Tax=mine drainage metagenome TaxID=410659 RepID=A0A1J5P872_9ZZZZ